MALNRLLCADVPLRTYTLTHPFWTKHLINMSPGPGWPDFGEISSNSYKDIAFTWFSESLPDVTLTFGPQNLISTSMNPNAYVTERVSSLQWTAMCRQPYFGLLDNVDCNAPHIFHRRVWYRGLSLRYVCIRHSGIIVTPTLPLCQISFVWRPPSSSPLEKYRVINQLLNHSVTQLIWCTRNQSFCVGTHTSYITLWRHDVFCVHHIYHNCKRWDDGSEQ